MESKLRISCLCSLTYIARGAANRKGHNHEDMKNSRPHPTRDNRLPKVRAPFD